MPSYSGIFTLQAQMQAVAAGTWTGLPRAIGSAYEGGFYAGQISTAGNGIADYNLVVGPLSTAQNSSVEWKTSTTTTAGTTSVIDGPTNSSNMNDASHPAAQFCEGLTIGGYTDWYMPAKNELEVCYYNLKPTTQNNNTSSGINANAVPARASNYTTGTPAQTSATAFRMPIIGLVQNPLRHTHGCSLPTPELKATAILRPTPSTSVPSAEFRSKETYEQKIPRRLHLQEPCSSYKRSG
jgi:hypothetical protein